ncbi:hypothetical protein Jiend_00250 [Micromonospora endophytica]|nr:hypothetical protein Jiend_00250 [Micromonospora endophytica]
MSTNPVGPALVHPLVVNDHALRELKWQLDEALNREWYRANQAGHANRDYRQRDLIKSQSDMIKDWKPAADAGGAWRGYGRRKGYQPPPRDVEKANLLMQMLADNPQLDRALAQSSFVRDVVGKAQAAEEQRARDEALARSWNPFAKAAHALSVRFGSFTPRQPSTAPGMPLTAATTRKRRTR